MPDHILPDEKPSDSQPIAVIGIGCRFSGKASSTEGFWETLRQGRQEHGNVPPSRYQAAAWEHPNPERKAAINHGSGFFLTEDPSRFDAPFFSITSKEAAGMDPVHRILLEVAYEAFENGGVPIESLPGSATGVYSGCMTNDYELLSTRDILDMPHNSATGNGRTMLANRLSWFFDLRGPSVMTDTACSSSLTALHLATQALRAGECSMAVVTGASLILHPNFTQRLSYMHMLSADGISHSFDSRANGYGRGEGFGAVLLKPLADALKDGDSVRAIIRATGINQDGRTPGITMPNAEAQAELIRATYRQANMSTADTTYFEAHGTGTEIGDPTELSAIGATFGVERCSAREPLYVGSVKSNLGHTEGAAGVASLIKLILCLERRTLVPNAGFSQLNPRIHLDKWGLRLSNTTMPWPAHLPQRASVNSFGFGGSNAHAILESLTEYLGYNETTSTKTVHGIPQLIVMSTHDKAGLARVAEKWKAYLGSHEPGFEPLVPDMAYTMAKHRSQLGFRSFVVADSLTALQDTIGGGLPQFSRASRQSVTNVAFVFTGQGSQWARMGIELLANPIFAGSIDRSQQVLQTLNCPWDLREELGCEATRSRIDQPDRSQPICCALQIALVDLLRSWEVFPRAVVGHSSGEAGAAYGAGFLSQDDAIRITYFRGLLSKRLADSGRHGSMLAVGISAADARTYLESVPEDSVVVACVNSPSSVTLSGNTTEINALEHRLRADGKFARRLRVEIAYHSPHMRPLADEYREKIDCIRPLNRHHDSIAMFSSVTEDQVDAQNLDASYWVQNLVRPVEFAAAVSKLATMTEFRKGRRRAARVKWGAFLEVGPHEALKGPFHQTLQAASADLVSIPYASPVRRTQDARQAALQAAGVLWSNGCSIDVIKTNQSFLGDVQPRMAQDLPSYAWNHQSSFWHEPLDTRQLRLRREARHDLLGVPVDYQNDLEPRWRNFLRVAEQPWIADHVVADSVVLPAAGIVAMVAEAARHLAGPPHLWLEGIEFHDLEFVRGLIIPPDDRGIEVSLHVGPHPGATDGYQFGLFTLSENATWVQHAKGFFTMHNSERGLPVATDWAGTVQRVQRVRNAARKVNINAVYEWLAKTGGVVFGQTFRSMVSVSFDSSSSQVCVSAVVPETKHTMPYECESRYFMHPTSLDALFQAAVISCSDALTNQEANIPVAVERLYLPTSLSLQPGDRFEIHAETSSVDGTPQSNVVASDSSWHTPGVALEGVRLGRVPMRSTSPGLAAAPPRSRFSSLQWAEPVETISVPGASACCHGSLQDWIRRVCHSRGDVKVLVVTTAQGLDTMLAALKDFLPATSQRPRFTQLAVVLCETDPMTREESVTAVEQAVPGGQVLPVASLQDVKQTILGSTLYDTVLFDHDQSWSDSAVVREVLATACADGAWVAIRTPSSARDRAMDCIPNTAWELSGSVQGPDCLLLHHRSSPTDLDSVVYVLTAESSDIPATLSEHLRTLVHDRGSRMEQVALRNAPDLTNKTVIALMELYIPWTANWFELQMKQFQSLLRAKHLLWVSRCPRQEAFGYAAAGATLGLLRTIRNENPNIALPHLLVDEQDAQDERSLAERILHVLQLTLDSVSGACDWEFSLQQNRLHVPRLIAENPVDDAMKDLLFGPTPVLAEFAQDRRPLRLRGNVAEVDSTFWEPDDCPEKALADDAVEVDLRMITLSASDRLSIPTPEARFEGVEAVGTVRQTGSSTTSALQVGDEVLCTLPSSPASTAIATRVHISERFVVKRPKQQTLPECVSMPVAYCTAYASLFGCAEPAPTSVLIIGSVSKTLLAIVDCALAANVIVYVAVDSQTASQQLEAQYPRLNGRVVRVHRDLAAAIRCLTDNEGVSLSVCTLGPNITHLAARCLAPNGRLVNIGEDMSLAALPQRLVERGCTISSLRISTILRDAPHLLRTYFQGALGLLEAHNMTARWQPYKSFPVSRLEDAVIHARETGSRAIIDFQAPGKVPIIPPLMASKALSAKSTYILAGGLGTVGLALARTLISCGAHHLVFLSRSGTAQNEQSDMLGELQAAGAHVDMVACDIVKREAVQSFLSRAKQSDWNIRGVIQCATVLMDTMFEHMGYHAWQQSTETKIRGTLNLHELLIDTPLEFFVTLSSVASVVGNMGQANYAAGNAFMDALMTWRRQHGQVGHSINVGLIPDASGRGEVAESAQQRRQRYRHLEGTEIELSELQSLVRLIVLDQVPVPAQLIAGVMDGLPRSEKAATWQFDRKFDHRVRVISEGAGGTSAMKTRTLLWQADTVDEAVRVVNRLLQEYLAGAMAAAADSIDLDLPLSALGVDSLKAAEVQNWVAREMGAELSSFEFLGSQPVKVLAERITAASTFISAVS